MIRERPGRPARTGAICSLLSNSYRLPEVGTAAFDQRIHGFWLPSHSGSQKKQQINTGTEFFGPPARARPVTPTRRGWVSDPRTASRPLSNCSPEAQAIRLAVLGWIPAPRNPSPAKPPPSSELRAPARWGSTSGDRSGGQTASRARLRHETRYPRLRCRAVSSLTLAGRGPGGSGAEGAGGDRRAVRVGRICLSPSA